ncbi:MULTISPECIES: DUF3846 domain-containing protein [unclassified Microbacterium]|uniref:DUF3846 domain-containing protein n=1 Tax=unclassified Microbacterium TaxID=2609290 RepID=UPI0028833412|nr:MULTISPECIES: DUF3846 domain-containing protein [unclassified Microbacterium]
MAVRSIIIPADPSDVVEIIDILPGRFDARVNEIVLGTYLCVDLNENVSLWLNDEGKHLELMFNQRAQSLWTQRHGSNTDVIVGPAVLTGPADSNGATLGLSDDQLAAVEARLGAVRVEVENTYEDGHSSKRLFLLPAPVDIEDPDEIEGWLEDEVFTCLGDGHGVENPKLGSLHEVKVLTGPEALVGKTYEF